MDFGTQRQSLSDLFLQKDPSLASLGSVNLPLNFLVLAISQKCFEAPFPLGLSFRLCLCRFLHRIARTPDTCEESALRQADSTILEFSFMLSLSVTLSANVRLHAQLRNEAQNALFHDIDFKLATCHHPLNDKVAKECGFTPLSIRIVKELVTLSSHPLLKSLKTSKAGRHLSGFEFHLPFRMLT
ncbi:hypothetical protein VNO77_14879 [Canavalia gladiata]|uniref:Uncharacterized protein n=1 Tax=Canavalia gladiata TaxID=3824 RepID=A0AAN9QR52_CANGL